MRLLWFWAVPGKHSNSMQSRTRHVTERLKTSYWFIPTIMLAGTAVLAFVSLEADSHLGSNWGSGWLYQGGPQGAREVLSVTAQSMITVAGVIFSIMIVALSLASQQLGPRLLRSFMRDRGTQITLGTFVSTFLYNLVVLRTIHVTDSGPQVPNISVSIGVLTALVSLGVLIYFIHHLSVLIQATSVITAVGHDLFDSINELYPKRISDSEREAHQEAPDVPDAFDRDSCSIDSVKTGHVQAVDEDQLIEIATQHDLVVRAETRPGRFVCVGTPLLLAWPANRISEQAITDLRDTFMIGSRQTLEQDTEFAVRQLVEVAVRAISPGINDPFTAMTAIDWLGAALTQLAQRSIPSPYRRDERGQLRLIASPTTFVSITNASFDLIRQYGRGHVAVTIRLLETIKIVAPRLLREEDRQVLLKQAIMIERGSHDAVPEESDRKDIRDSYDATLRALTQKDSTTNGRGN